MKAIPKTEYQCDVCKHVYSTEKEALKCESKPVTQDRGVKIGDRVRITSGDGTGLECEVSEIFIISKDWGHYAWERYWHTVGVSGKVIGSWGSRMLTFDSYALNGDAK
jgi:hypothetical protein